MHDFCCLTQMHGALQPPAKARVTFLDTRPSPACQHRRHVSSRARATCRWHVYGPDVTAQEKKRQYVRAQRERGSKSNRARRGSLPPNQNPVPAGGGGEGTMRTRTADHLEALSLEIERKLHKVSLSLPIPIPPPARPPPFLLLAYGRFAIV
jgi:hypothetical protein